MELITNEVVINEYSKKNYKIEYNENSTENIAVIYFSSNGLYYPNDIDTFSTAIVEKNRFEWSRNKISNAKKHIFVRDIFKQWYISGISKKNNTVNKVKEFLKAETEGYKVVTVGSSAGGYAAILFGILLKAEYVLSFAAQFTLYPQIRKSNPNKDSVLFKHLNNSNYNNYYDLSNLINNNDTTIYYFCPSRCEIDRPQLQAAESCKKVKILKISSDKHGIPCTLPCLKTIINLDKNKLDNLFKHYEQKEINFFYFSIKTSGLKTNISYFLKHTQKKIIKNYF
ncbi:hypothetical protein [Exiguobacterium sp. s102]|uniref:hypothetical protein n=1 Tax=Exiguobacterium sp. s102 TaxID=2751212 RepID=UPI001BE68968|nr:hypothetical protein [Exiguobacterium sp. s102]